MMNNSRFVPVVSAIPLTLLTFSICLLGAIVIACVAFGVISVIDGSEAEQRIGLNHAVGGEDSPANPNMSDDGSNTTQTPNRFDQSNNGLPKWSPDGNSIGFVESNNLYRSDVTVVDGVPQVSNFSFLANDALGPFAWSPRGDAIAFAGKVGGSNSIQILRLADG